MSIYGSKSIRRIAILLCTALFMSIVTVGCKGDTHETPEINDTLLVSKNFYVLTEETGTSAQGTILILQSQTKKNMIDIQIVAFIDIASDDWGGVALYFPNGCRVSEIISTYPEQDIANANSVVHWFTGNDDIKYGSSIEIARNRESNLSSGGKGTIIINMEPIPKTDELHFAIEAGAYIQNGIVIWGAAFEEVVVYLHEGD